MLLSSPAMFPSWTNIMFVFDVFFFFFGCLCQNIRTNMSSIRWCRVNVHTHTHTHYRTLLSYTLTVVFWVRKCIFRISFYISAVFFCLFFTSQVSSPCSTSHSALSVWFSASCADEFWFPLERLKRKGVATWAHRSVNNLWLVERILNRSAASCRSTNSAFALGFPPPSTIACSHPTAEVCGQCGFRRSLLVFFQGWL